jgi:hypothetical protein
MFSRLNKGYPGTRQDNPEFSECARHGIDIYHAAVLFHDNIMAHRQTKSGAFTRGFSREEGVEYLFFYFGRYSGAIVTDEDLNLVTQILRRGGQRRLETVTGIRFTFCCRVESVFNLDCEGIPVLRCRPCCSGVTNTDAHWPSWNSWAMPGTDSRAAI